MMHGKEARGAALNLLPLTVVGPQRGVPAGPQKGFNPVPQELKTV